MAVVFATNRSGEHDYSSAEKYGGVRFITIGNYPVFKTARLVEEIIKALVHSNPDDFLLYSGSGVVASLCTVIWLEMHKKVQMLMWDRTEKKYVLRLIDRTEMRVEIERAVDALGRR